MIIALILNHPEYCEERIRSELATIIYAAIIGALSSLLAAVAPNVGPESTNAILSIIDDSKLRLICVAGSLGGAILSVGFFPPERNGNVIRGVALKLSCSSISGVMFTPAIMRWFNIEFQTDIVLACSGTVSLLSWSVLQMAVPLITRIIRGRITDTDKKHRP